MKWTNGNVVMLVKCHHVCLIATDDDGKNAVKEVYWKRQLIKLSVPHCVPHCVPRFNASLVLISWIRCMCISLLDVRGGDGGYTSSGVS